MDKLKIEKPEWIKSEWLDLVQDNMIESYIKYVSMGKYDKRFILFLENNSKCQQAVELALNRQYKDVKDKIKAFKKPKKFLKIFSNHLITIMKKFI